ncbi:MAG TPA: MAPEG family protein [Telluria sp.]|nr:MAPEG family protein [Telluria sp.]
MNPVAAICVAALGLLLFGLGLGTSINRKKARRSYGCADDPASPLYKFMRAHGNTAEYAPFFAVLMLFLGTRDPAPWVVWTMVAATACRYIFVAGLVAYPSMARPNALRFIGGLGTYVTGLVLSAAVLFSV